MNALVPERAMVPRLLMRSALVMPTPVSWIARVLFSLSVDSRILSSFSESSALASVSERKRILSSASDAFEISSRRKTSCRRSHANAPHTHTHTRVFKNKALFCIQRDGQRVLAKKKTLLE